MPNTEGIIRIESVDEFKSRTENIGTNSIICDETGYIKKKRTLLQFCCRHNLVSEGTELIDKGADIRKIADEEDPLSPLQISCYLHRFELTEKIVEKIRVQEASEDVRKEISRAMSFVVMRQNLRSDEKTKELLKSIEKSIRELGKPTYRDVLEKMSLSRNDYDELLSNLSNQIICTENDRIKCFKVVLPMMKELHIDPNQYPDKRNMTPFLYAIHFQDLYVIKEFMNMNSFHLTTPINKVMIIQNLECKFVQHHFDNCLLVKDIDNKDFKYEIKFKYKSLTKRKQHEPQIEENIIDTLLHMHRNPNFKSLLSHPLLLAFVLMKWHKVKIYYWIEVVMYMIQFFSLLVLITWNDIVALKRTSLTFLILICVFQIVSKAYIMIKTRTCKRNNIALAVLAIALVLISLISNAKTDTFKLLLCVVTFAHSLETISFLGVWIIYGKMFSKVTVQYLILFACFGGIFCSFTATYKVIFQSNNQNVTDLFYNTTKFLMGAVSDSDFPESSSSLCRLVYIILIFVFSVIFINFLNALSVDDIHYLKENSEIETQQQKLEYFKDINVLLACIKEIKKIVSVFTDETYFLVKINEKSQNKGIYLDDENFNDMLTQVLRRKGIEVIISTVTIEIPRSNQPCSDENNGSKMTINIHKAVKESLL